MEDSKTTSWLAGDFIYIVLIFGLFVFPKFLQRFRIPSAITSFLLGVIFAWRFPELGKNETIHLLATFGITALFLFAGLDLELSEMRRGARFILQHLFTRLLSLIALCFLLREIFSLDFRPAALVALALLTPSTGFILDSLPSFRVGEKETFWIKTHAIAGEFLALGALFFVLQTASFERFLLSSATIAGMIILLPFLFQWFFFWIAPFAPKSDFAFLIMVALMCAFVSRELGVYYLTGAFVAGMAARRLQDKVPSLASKKMIHAVEVFASFFVPFYFFSAGSELPRSALIWESLAVGACFLAVVLPLRFLGLGFHRKVSLGENWKDGFRVCTALLPTFIFTLVMAHILTEQFSAPPYLFGGLAVYAIVNTLIPGLLLQTAPVEFGKTEDPNGGKAI